MHPLLYKRARALALLVFLPLLIQMWSLSAFSQSRDYALGHGQDYYEPRITEDQKRTLANVQLYHLGPGLEAMKTGRWYQALQEFEFILRYYPNHPQVLGLVSEICVKAGGNYCKISEDWFEKALARNPDASGTHLLYGFHMHRKRNTKAAVKSYQRALELDPDSVNAHYNLGLAYADLKEYELANKHAQLSYQLGANLPGLRVRLEKLGKWNPAAVAAATDTAKSAEPAAPGDAVKSK